MELDLYSNIWNSSNSNHSHCATAHPQDPLPWCYTTDPDVRWEHCDCDDTKFHPHIRTQLDYCTKTTTIKGNIMPILYGHIKSRTNIPVLRVRLRDRRLRLQSSTIDYNRTVPFSIMQFA